MIKITIEKGWEQIFKGHYEYLEGGREKSGEPGFHVSVTSDERENREIYFYFDSEEEFKEFIEDLIKIRDEKDENTR